MMNPKSDKLVRRTTMVATATASYFLLTADYGPQPNALDPEFIMELQLQVSIAALVSFTISGLIKNAILSAERSVKDFIFGSKKEFQESETTKLSPSAAEKHP